MWKKAGDFLSETIKKNVSSRIRGLLEAIIFEKIPLANKISFKNIMGGPKITMSRRLTSSLLVWDVCDRHLGKERVISYWKTSRKKVSNRIRGPLEAIERRSNGKKSHSLIRFHSKTQRECPKSPYPGVSRVRYWAGTFETDIFWKKTRDFL